MVKLNKNFLATAIGTKFARPYAYIFMEKVEIEFLESQDFGMVSVHRRCHGEEKLRLFLKDLNVKDLIKFTHEADKESPFWV